MAAVSTARPGPGLPTSRGATEQPNEHESVLDRVLRMKQQAERHEIVNQRSQVNRCGAWENQAS